MYPANAPDREYASSLYCEVCGQQVEPDWRFCIRCGSVIRFRGGDTQEGAGSAENPLVRGGVGLGVGDVALGTGFYVIQAISILAIVLVVARVVEVEYTGVPLLVGMLFVQLALPLTIWIFAVLRRNVRWSALGLWRKPAWRDAGWGVVVLIAEMVVQVVYYLILEAAGVDTEELSPTPFVEAGSEYLIGLAILAVAVAPIAEELFFRGFVFGGLAGRWGPWWAAGVSALLFMAVHLEPLSFPPLFVLGLLLAWLYHRTRTLWGPILVHFGNNSIAMGVLLADVY